MKRVRGSDHCLMLLPKIGDGCDGAGSFFRCKTCDKQFPSFQALGGHRASHKKPKLNEGDGHDPVSPEKKPKAHECPICGMEFALGQALGGHMRRHRAAAAAAAEVIELDLVTRDFLPAFERSGSNRCLNVDLSLHLGPPSIDFFM